MKEQANAHIIKLQCRSGADPGFCNGGGGGGPRFVAKRVTYTSKASYEHKSAGGPGGAVIFFNLEPLRVNLSVI